MRDIGALLDELTDYISRNPAQAIFRLPASDEEIAAAESAMQLALPESYRRFLQRFNGGFISLCGDSSDSKWNQRAAEWNSNALFGTERMVTECLRWRQLWQTVGWSGDWIYVPFCQTEGQELLMFGTPTPASGDATVLDAFHEMPPEEWRAAYPSFTQLLSEYIESNGHIRTIS